MVYLKFKVGNNIQQNYILRFRDNSLIYKLFAIEENKPEVTNMNCLFEE